MPYLEVNEISKSFGDLSLIENASFVINEGQKVALIAQNGAGKSTLLNIITEQLEADSGTVRFEKDLNISYLSQNIDLDENMSVSQVVFSAQSPILKAVEQYEEAILHPDNQQAYQIAIEQMDRLNAWDLELRFKQILTQLKINDLKQKITALSGGQKKRVALAMELINTPDFLILDEPTNHLDLDMIEWLENFIIKERITLLMVTHDRYFLERTCSEILELSDKTIYRYKGNYSYYLEKREERLENQQKEVDKARNLMRTEIVWMRSTPPARTSKSKYRIDNFEKLREQASVRRNESAVELNIDMKRLGSKIAEFKNVCFAFDDKIMLDNFSYNFNRAERIGIIGNNGTGKTTFLNLLTGALKAGSGDVEIGETVSFGYYNQQGINFNDGDRVIDAIREIAEYMPLAGGKHLTAEALLEKFLFERKRQYDFIEKLSGGEKKRLYLCSVLITNPNFLILDEPTNDLDIVTINVLEAFLQDFQGNIIVVSHDRYFMDKIVDQLFVFRGNAVIEVFAGSYSHFRLTEDRKAQSEKLQDNTPKASEIKNWRQETKTKKLNYNEQREFDTLEAEIDELNKQKANIEKGFELSEFSQDDIVEKSKELETINKLLDDKEDRWLELSMKIE
ncbi:MAG: ABC-F family ATP-binding cassette domain-containing protein [Bacteroidales bacterium]